MDNLLDYVMSEMLCENHILLGLQKSEIYDAIKNAFVFCESSKIKRFLTVLRNTEYF